jgi:thioester reductase-like protein
MQVRSTITLIIHNAWRLDFNLSLSAFEPNVRGTRRLIDLALTSAHASSLRFLFTSSVGVTQAWPASRGPFPEESQEDLHWCIGSGYGEGKQVSERLLIAAAKRGLQTTSLRLGQITGGYANGAWATTDWVPLMIKSSVTMGFLPMTKGVSIIACLDYPVYSC